MGDSESGHGLERILSLPQVIDIVKPLTVALAAWTGGIVTGILTPLQSNILNLIYREKAQLISAPSKLTAYAGQQTALIIAIKSKSYAAVSDGELQITPSTDAIQLANDQDALLRTPSVPTAGAANYTVQLVARQPGAGNLDVMLTTSHGKYVVKIPYTVEASKTAGYPSPGNFSGKWFFVMNGHNGVLNLQDVGHQLLGTYSYDDGPQTGTTEGLYDGQMFRLQLSRGTAPFYYWIEATWKADGTGVVLNGSASLKPYQSSSASASPGTVQEMTFEGVSEHPKAQ